MYDVYQISREIRDIIMAGSIFTAAGIDDIEVKIQDVLRRVNRENRTHDEGTSYCTSLPEHEHTP